MTKTMDDDELRAKENDLAPVEWTDDDEILLRDSMRDLDEWGWD